MSARSSLRVDPSLMRDHPATGFGFSGLCPVKAR
jgi:hypothetical protein